MTKKIDKNEFYFTSFNKELSEFIKDMVNRRAKDFIDTKETVVNETTIFMIKKGEKKIEFEVDYNLRSIKMHLLNIDIDAVLKEIDTLVMTKIFSSMFE